MTTAVEYRIQAAKFDALARQETEPLVQANLRVLAKAYRRLAELADRKAVTDNWLRGPTGTG